MDNPRPEKVAVVDEVRERLAAADGAVLTEYRGLTVAELAALRNGIGAAGGDYKIYKNTLVRLAVADSPQSGLTDLLIGPTAIAFVHGDVSAVAKALRDFSRDNPSLVIKGGMMEGGLLSAAEVNALAALPSRDVLMSQFAGALAAPMQQLAGLLQALPRNLAYGLAALADQRRASGEGVGEDEGGESAAAVTAAEGAAAGGAATDEATTDAAGDTGATAEAAAASEAPAGAEATAPPQTDEAGANGGAEAKSPSPDPSATEETVGEPEIDAASAPEAADE